MHLPQRRLGHRQPHLPAAAAVQPRHAALPGEAAAIPGCCAPAWHNAWPFCRYCSVASKDMLCYEASSCLTLPACPAAVEQVHAGASAMPSSLSLCRPCHARTDSPALGSSSCGGGCPADLPPEQPAEPVAGAQRPRRPAQTAGDLPAPAGGAGPGRERLPAHPARPHAHAAPAAPRPVLQPQAGGVVAHPAHDSQALAGCYAQEQPLLAPVPTEFAQWLHSSFRRATRRQC